MARGRRIVPVMEARTILQLPTTDVRVDGERILIDRLDPARPSLAAIVADREPADRPSFIERALKIGLTALQDATVSVDVDLVRDEFEKLLRSSEQANAKAAEALDQVLRANFADGDGRLPRTLEKFLGDRGALRMFVGELFDETKRDSAIGRMRTLLGTYFDGDASKLALLLDPTRQHSPMHQFRTEVAAGFERLHERLASIEAAAAARGAERARSAAKGGGLRGRHRGAPRRHRPRLRRPGRSDGHGDRRAAPLEEGRFRRDDRSGPDGRRGRSGRRRGQGPGDLGSARSARSSARRSRTGAPPSDWSCSARLTPRRASRRSTFARATCTASSIRPHPDPATLEAALRLARLHAIASLREVEAEVDVEAVRAALAAVRAELDALKGIKATLTSISSSATGSRPGLDRLRDAVIARVAEAEAEIRAAAWPPLRLPESARVDPSGAVPG